MKIKISEHKKTRPGQILVQGGNGWGGGEYLTPVEAREAATELVKLANRIELGSVLETLGEAGTSPDGTRAEAPAPVEPSLPQGWGELESSEGFSARDENETFGETQVTVGEETTTVWQRAWSDRFDEWEESEVHVATGDLVAVLHRAGVLPRQVECAGCSKRLTDGADTNWCPKDCVCMGAVYCQTCWNEHKDRAGVGPDVGEALDLALSYGGIDGAHHKTWVIDQMVRALTGDGYEEWVRGACAGEDGPDTYHWDEGIAP